MNLRIFTVLVTVSLTVVVLLSLSFSNVYALTNVNNTSFSIDIPDNWTYGDRSSVLLGVSKIALTPNKFGGMLLNVSTPLSEQMKEEGAFSSFEMKWDYRIKNAPLDLFVKYEIDKQDGIQVTSRQNVTIDNETAVKIYADGINSFSGIKFVEYMVMHEKQPFYIGYMANVNDFERYLPEFEQIVKTFKFTG